MSINSFSYKILLVGNPNVGKSTLFNALCNMKQKTGNYAGVTVSSHRGEYSWNGKTVEIIDLPGSYSIYPNSGDETLFSDYLLNERNNYQGVIYVLDCLNIKRGLLLLEQIQDLKIPVIIIANQIDEAEKRGISVQFENISKRYSALVIPANAKDGIGIDEIKKAIDTQKFRTTEQMHFEIPKEYQLNIVSEKGDTTLYEDWHRFASGKNKHSIVPKRLQTVETIRRYQAIEKDLHILRNIKDSHKKVFTENLDNILVHPFWGYIIFSAVLLFIFQLVFFMAEYPMNWIDAIFVFFSESLKEILPEGPINSLLTNGIIPGIGGIVIFAPQIGILLYLLYLLEDSGYMARVVYLMDRFLRPFGLNGKSVVPLVSGAACAIPAIMSTRNIENTKERLITILVTPFVTCSARLPVYSIIISLIIPKGDFLGISYQAIALLTMYIIGFLAAIASAWILKISIQQKVKSFLIMELPNYKTPRFGYDIKLALFKVWGFISGAGKVIFAVSIILWSLSYIGPGEGEIKTNVELQESYLSKIGKKIEPIVEPLGYDWKMGVGIISSFAAREVFVSTMSTLYSLDEESEETRLIEKMKSDKKSDGSPTFSFATGVSILLYYAFAMQCISTIAIVYRETKSCKWTLVQVVSMTSLAYFVSLIMYQILK